MAAKVVKIIDICKLLERKIWFFCKDSKDSKDNKGSKDGRTMGPISLISPIGAVGPERPEGAGLQNGDKRLQDGQSPTGRPKAYRTRV